MNTTDATHDDRVLGEFEPTIEQAREDDNFTVFELPEGMIEEHLTTTFTPSRYRKLCRDIAYFTSGVGNAPQQAFNGGSSSPGSGLRRSKEGACYKMPAGHRKGLLSRAVEMGLIEIENDDGFDAHEGEWRFSIADRGRWFLHHTYGDHVPVRKVSRVEVSRTSARTNVSKIVITPDDDTSIKSVEEWERAVKAHERQHQDPASGYYHISRDVVDDPGTDPAGEPLVGWIEPTSVPKQFDVDALEGDVRVRCDPPTSAGNFGSAEPLRITRDDETGDLIVEEAATQAGVWSAENTGGNAQKFGIRGDYEDFVESDAKDALKDATNAKYNSDYRTWYVTPDEFLLGVEAMLRDSDLEEFTVADHLFGQFSEYL